MEKKQQVSIAQLCQGCPSQFAEFLGYSRSLKFDAKPDIPYLRKLFRDLYHAQGCASVGKMWDWDHIDTDFMTTGTSTGSVGGAPPVTSNAMRPNTAAAITGELGVDHADKRSGEDEYLRGTKVYMCLHFKDNEFIKFLMLQDRPVTVGASSLPPTAAKPRQLPHTSSTQEWGFTRQPNEPSATAVDQSGAAAVKSGASAGVPAAEFSLVAGITDPSHRRPHTAHGGRGAISSAAQPLPSAAEVRKSAASATGEDHEEVCTLPRFMLSSRITFYCYQDADAHVVAGARAMMRYRKTRTSASEEASGIPPDGEIGRSSWAGSVDPKAAAAHRTGSQIPQMAGTQPPTVQSKQGHGQPSQQPLREKVIFEVRESNSYLYIIANLYYSGSRSGRVGNRLDGHCNSIE